MKKNLYCILYIGILILFVTGCQNENLTTPDMNEPVYITYRVKMTEESLSRAIGDGMKVNELKVGVFQDNRLQKIFTFEKEEQTNAFAQVTLPLLKQKTYNLVFWAHKKNNAIYSIDTLNFNVNIDYSQYTAVSLASTEDFEAFTTVKEGVTVDNPGDANVTLNRPFAQLNIAASKPDIFEKVNKTTFTISKVYKVFNPLNDTVSEELDNQTFSISISEADVNAKQKIVIDGNSYYYLASAYMLAPQKVELTGALYNDTVLVKELNFQDLPLSANTRTNLYGDMIQQEEGNE